MSIRTFSRHFRAQVGDTPANWIAHARVRRAKLLLETTQLAIERVASESGFGSPTVLRHHFAAIVGTTHLPIAARFSDQFRAAIRSRSATESGGSLRAATARLAEMVNDQFLAR